MVCFEYLEAERSTFVIPCDDIVRQSGNACLVYLLPGKRS